MLVSRLVALAWCDGHKEGYTVNHIDGDTNNNNASNLEWVSISENIKKGFEEGLFSASCKPCVIIDKNGNEYNFVSLSKASSFIHRNIQYVSCRINRGSNIVIDANGEIYKIYLQDKDNIQRKEDKGA